MSEKSKGDTSSSSMIPAPSRVVKNPLLSASVTGLTFEDFPNKPLLLPAAPPVVHVSTAASPAPVLGLGIMNREPKSLVTVGQTSDIDRDETLSEINLNTNADDTQPPAQIETNSNSLLEQNPNTDSILSQAASSFSALPSVASSVLSTFSKRIYSTASSRERTPVTEEADANANPISELDIQPSYTQHNQQQNQYYSTPPQQFNTATELSAAFVPSPFAGGNNYIGTPTTLTGSLASTQSHYLNNEPLPGPPKLYTPAEVPTLNAANVATPLPAGVQNTYRLTAKKKLYAPIPGFSDATNQYQAAPTVDPSAISAPISAHTQATPYGYPQSDLYDLTQSQQQQHQPVQPKTEERKGGLFSITNLVSTGVLQNISGLVQSAAGTIAQTVKPDSTHQSSFASQQQQQHQEQTSFDLNFVDSKPSQPAASTQNFLATSYAPPVQPVALTQNYFATPYTEQTVPVTSTQKIFTAPYPTEAQQIQVGLPTLPAQTNLFAATSNQILTGNPLVPVSTQLGFEQLLSDSTSANLQTTLQAAQIAAEPEPKTETSLSQPANKISLFAPPAQVTEPSYAVVGSQSVTTTTAAISACPASTLTSTVPPAVVPALISLFDPFRPPTQPIPTATTNLSSNTFFDPIKLTSQPAPVATTNLTPTSFFTPIVPGPSQPGPAASSHLTTNTFCDPIRPSHQSASTTLTPIKLFDPTQPPSQTSTAEFVQQPSHSDPQLLPQTPTSNISKAPPLLTQQLPPPSKVGQPPATSGPSSFRLQKGTRLYKNPLTSLDTVPAAYLNQPLQQPALVQPPPAAHISPQSIFNPFASTVATAERSPALFVPETLPTRELKEDPLVDKQSPVQFVPDTLPSRELTEDIPVDTQSPALLVPKPDKSQPIDFFSTDPAASNSLLLQELTGPQPIDHFRSHTVQSAEAADLINNASILETVSEQSTTELDPINSKAETIESEQHLIESPIQQESTEVKAGAALNFIVGKPAQEQAVETAFQAANFLPPPPQLTALQGIANPYRKEHTAATHAATTASSTTAAATQPSLANFFTPIESDSSTDFNFFSTPSKTAESSQPLFSTSALFSEPKNISDNNSTTSTNFFQLQTPNAPSPSPQLTPKPTPTPSPKPTLTPTPAPIANLNADPCDFHQLPPQTCIAPPALFREPDPTDFIEHPAIVPPLGFDNLIATADNSSAQTVANVVESLSQATTIQQAPNLHSVSNFFNKTSNFQNFETTTTTTAKAPERNLPDPTSFFDTFAPASTAAVGASQPPTANRNQSTKQQQTNEDQRIQNFFNNPPPQELGGSVGDLNYDLVHGGLVVKNLQKRSLTPASILVEPPSSSCSEFSELNSSLQGQRQNISADSSNKISPEVENKTPPIVEAVIATTNDNNSTATAADDLTKHYKNLPEEVLQELRMANLLLGEKAAATAPPATISTYLPAVKHWFFKRIISNKTYWTPFSHYDSALLETALVMSDNAANIVAVEGGRYDVNICERTKTPVYWEGKPIEVRRCSWFYKATDSRYVPYEEETAERLEAEYKLAAEKGEWHKKIIISMGEQVVFHGPTVIVHFQQQQNVDAWGGSSQTTTRPRVVKRDLEDFAIEQGESQRVDHLLLMVHGIGSACDLKMRSVEEVVDEFRSIAQQLVSSHYKNSTEMGLVGRVEILPISWHSHLHSEEMGIDEKLKSITLESIPKLRNFANDTLLDVLFYTSPTYCQTIMNTVASSMNSVYAKYRQRHPEFSGGVSVAGHSLGSLILFDMLCHQHPIKEIEEENMEIPDQEFATSSANHLSTTSNGEQNPAKHISYTMGTAGTGQPFIHYEQLLFQPKKFFAMGSPIGVFVTIRGIDKLGLDFRLPTCSGFYNIFHPFDPVAYRIEALVNPDMNGIRPVLIPHHKGRKRMHLELRETMTRVGADLKQRFMDTFKNTLETVNFLGSTSTSRGNKENEAKETMEKEVDKVLKMQLDLDQPDVEQLLTDEQKTLSHTRLRTDSASTSFSDTDIVEIDLPLGKLNDSKRVDYVLQEAPLEFFNEYLFALSSHVCYWESEDTILFVMKEIYTGLGVSPDSQVPQQSMTIERPSTRNSQNNDAAQDQVSTST